MEREVSISTELAVGLVATAALLGFVFFFVAQGLFIKDETAEILTDITDSVGYDYVVSLANSGESNDMPAVTAYNILTKYYKVIVASANGVPYSPEIESRYFPTESSRVTDLQVSGSELINDLATLSDRVQLELVPTGQGTYVAFIHPKNSLWRSGTIDTTCEYVSPYLNLISKYNIPASNLNWTLPSNWRTAPSVKSCERFSLILLG